MARTVTYTATGARVVAAGPGLRIPLTLVAGVLALALVFFVAAQVGSVLGVKFAPEGFTNIGQVLAPVLLMALFIERSTEVVISSWRDAGWRRLKTALDTAPEADRPHWQQALDLYGLETQRLAFLVSGTLALIAAIVGLRVIQPLLDATAVQQLAQGQTRTQWLWLSTLDVVLTGLLMAGGADGIHQIMTTFTTFLNSTRDRAAAAAQPAPPPTVIVAAPQPAVAVPQPAVAAAAPPVAAPAAPAVAASGDADDGV